MKHNLKCEECSKEFIHIMSHTKTCSEDCRSKRAIKKWGRYSDKSIASGTVGAVSEITISADLMKKGYAVFRSLSPACFCDVIATKGNEMLRVEIRTGYSAVNGKVSFPTRTNGEIDIYGVYDRANNKCFYFNKDLKQLDI